MNALSPAPDRSDPTEERRHWMAILARAGANEIATRLQACSFASGWRMLRGPESGLVMLRGRAGGGGAPFNIGEATVTRCTVRTGSGHIGHAYVLGRDGRQAELAAAVDGLLQDPSVRDALLSAVITPLAEAQAERRRMVAAKAAATRVQFFAMRTMRT